MSQGGRDWKAAFEAERSKVQQLQQENRQLKAQLSQVWCMARRRSRSPPFFHCARGSQATAHGTHCALLYLLSSACKLLQRTVHRHSSDSPPSSNSSSSSASRRRSSRHRRRSSGRRHRRSLLEPRRPPPRRG